MKNLLLIIAVFILIPSHMRGHFTETNHKANIIITNDLLTCKSVLKHKADKWQVRHIKQLKIGVNKFYFVPFDGMGVNIEIVKY